MLIGLQPASFDFALSSASVFCRSDTLTDSERFYVSVLEFLDDPEEKDEVDDLLNWWNWYDIFIETSTVWLTLFLIVRCFLVMSSVLEV